MESPSPELSQSPSEAPATGSVPPAPRERDEQHEPSTRPKLVKAVTLRDLYTKLKNITEAPENGSPAMGNKGEEQTEPRSGSDDESQPVSSEMAKFALLPVPMGAEQPTGPSSSDGATPLRLSGGPSGDGSQLHSTTGSMETSPRDSAQTQSQSTSPRRKGFFGTLGKLSTDKKAVRRSSHIGLPSSTPSSSGSPSPALSPDGPSPRDNADSVRDLLSRSPPLSGSPPRKSRDRSLTNPKDTKDPQAAKTGATASPQTRGGTRSNSPVIKPVDRAKERTRKKELIDEKKRLKEAKQLDLLKHREVEELVMLILESSLVVPVDTLMRELPRLKLSARRMGDPLHISSGPTAQDENGVLEAPIAAPQFAPHMAGRTVSTYPLLKGGTEGKREGAPICDSFLMQQFRDGAVVSCVADGCGWGARNRDAAIKAKVALVDYVSRKLSHVSNVAGAAEMLYRALGEAHYKIVEGKEDISLAGTTAIIGGCAVPCVPGPHVAFVFVSVGDCKAFVRKASTHGKIVDLTLGSRNNVSDPKDPGGRIGPYIRAELPDLRNLRFGCCVCEEGDMIIMTSDGVSDNLDPEFHGLTPHELGMAGVMSWDAVVDKEAAVRLKGEWSCDKMAQLLDATSLETGVPICPELAVKSLIEYCVTLTKPSREWLESTTVGQLPSDYARYPGKQDHATCIAMRITRGE